ncbi:hypothetical protein MFRU_028g00510 [Monilinia fructicola]|nr:hypothetical protein MFRU_028g00510 [Monilinia fructicola]
MAGFLSRLKKSCKDVFNSLKYTVSWLRNWFHREAVRILQEIASTIQHVHRNYLLPFLLRILRFIDNHPVEIAIGVLTIIIIYPNIISLLLLFILGFAVMGPAAGSLATFIQALIGNVTAGSLFAIFQSAGMLGIGLGILNTCVVGIAVLILVLLLVHMIMKTN